MDYHYISPRAKASDNRVMRHLRLAARVSFACAALSAVSGCDLLQNPVEPPPPTTGIVSYTALGASDAIGFGSSQPCVPFASCPNGTGYVQIVARRLRDANPTMTFLNLGIPGAVLSREIMTIGNNLGRGIPANFIDGEVPFVPTGSTIVTVFPDANGVNALAAAMKSLTPGPRSTFKTLQIQNFVRDFTVFINGIHARAANATVIVFNMPNLSRLPYAAGYSGDEREQLRDLSVAFSAAMNATRSAKVRVIDLMCQPAIYTAAFYSSDGFHPSDFGYLSLADQVSAAIVSAPAPPPTSCAFMQ